MDTRSRKIGLFAFFLAVLILPAASFMYSPEIVLHCQKDLCGSNLSFNITSKENATDATDISLDTQTCSPDSPLCFSTSSRPEFVNVTTKKHEIPKDAKLSYTTTIAPTKGREGHNYYETFHVYSSKIPYANVERQKGCWTTKIVQQKQEFYTIQWEPRLDKWNCYETHTGGFPGRNIVVNKYSVGLKAGVALAILGGIPLGLYIFYRRKNRETDSSP